jgi:hypothetical protein
MAPHRAYSIAVLCHAKSKSARTASARLNPLLSCFRISMISTVSQPASLLPIAVSSLDDRHLTPSNVNPRFEVSCGECSSAQCSLRNASPTLLRNFAREPIRGGNRRRGSFFVATFRLLVPKLGAAQKPFPRGNGAPHLL